MLQTLNSKAAHFQKARKASRRSRHEPAMGGPDMNSIVRYQPRKG